MAAVRSAPWASRPSRRVRICSYSLAANGFGAPSSWKRRRNAASFEVPGGSTAETSAHRSVASLSTDSRVMPGEASVSSSPVSPRVADMASRSQDQAANTPGAADRAGAESLDEDDD